MLVGQWVCALLLSGGQGKGRPWLLLSSSTRWRWARMAAQETLSNLVYLECPSFNKQAIPGHTLLSVLAECWKAFFFQLLGLSLPKRESQIVSVITNSFYHLQLHPWELRKHCCYFKNWGGEVELKTKTCCKSHSRITDDQGTASNVPALWLWWPKWQGCCLWSSPLRSLVMIRECQEAYRDDPYISTLATTAEKDTLIKLSSSSTRRERSFPRKRLCYRGTIRIVLIPIQQQMKITDLSPTPCSWVCWRSNGLRCPHLLCSWPTPQ